MDKSEIDAITALPLAPSTGQPSAAIPVTTENGRLKLTSAMVLGRAYRLEKRLGSGAMGKSVSLRMTMFRAYQKPKNSAA